MRRHEKVRKRHVHKKPRSIAFIFIKARNMSWSYYTLMVLVIGFYHHIFFCQILEIKFIMQNCKFVSLNFSVFHQFSFVLLCGDE